MAFIKNKTIEIGSWVILTKAIVLKHGTFEKGTKVKIIGESERGYDFEDEEGNKAYETGFLIGTLI